MNEGCDEDGGDTRRIRHIYIRHERETSSMSMPCDTHTHTHTPGKIVVFGGYGPPAPGSSQLQEDVQPVQQTSHEKPLDDLFFLHLRFLLVYVSRLFVRLCVCVCVVSE